MTESSQPEGIPAQPEPAASAVSSVVAQPESDAGAAEANAGSAPAETPAAKPRRKRRLVFGSLAAGVGAVALGILAAMFIYWAFTFTESTQFCTTCHVMKPEKVAHSVSPHQRTNCGTCHVGPGAAAAVKAKFANVRYLWVAPLHLYETPIPSPINSLRPAEVVCEQCHWPQKTYSDKIVLIPYYAEDAKNTQTNTQLALHTGGGAPELGLGRGIHWHIDNPVYYIAADQKLQVIPWVQASYNGVTTTYTSVDTTLTQADIDSAEKLSVDCVTCHNRATHMYRNPSDALSGAMATGNIPADLPYIKREGDRVLLATYPSEEEAATAIAGVEDFYRTTYPDIYAARTADVQKAVAGLQAIFDTTQFPFMNVNWKSHTDNIGHKNFPGCFRCHDGKHLSADDQAIRLECNLCHTIPQVTPGGQPLPPIPLQPQLPEPSSHKTTTWIAEHRYSFDSTCAACHTVTDPGGTSNTSFCSNPACHGAQWTYIDLNAPRVRELSAPKASPTRAPAAPVAAPTAVAPTSVPAAQTAAPAAPTATAAAAAPTSAPAAPATVPVPVATRPPAPTAAPAAGGPPAIPHSLAGRDNCLQCHSPGGGIKPAPADHAGRTNETCQGCHKPKQ